MALKNAFRLRDETRGRTIAVAGIADPVRAEPDLAVVEEEDRGLGEIAIGIGREIIARTVYPQIPVLLQSLRVREQDAGDFVRVQAELVQGVILTHLLHRLSFPPRSGLGGDDVVVPGRDSPFIFREITVK